jgi:type VII secretion-associated serine protease mycosin
MLVRGRGALAAALTSVVLIGATPATAQGPLAAPTLDVTRLDEPARTERGEDPAEPAAVGLLVRAEPDATAEQVERAIGAEGHALGDAVGDSGWYRVEVADAPDLETYEDVGASLEEAQAISQAVPEYVRTASRTPRDPYFESQRYLRTIRAPAAWDATTGSANVIVAVLDTGIAAGHPDLQGKVVKGRSFVPGVTSTNDPEGHGTAVAGLIAAGTDNDEGIAGLGWQTKVMPVKVLDARGVGTDGGVAQGIRWAADQGVQVINLSLGGPGQSPVLDEAVTYARSKGAVVVAAAGNESWDVATYPAASPGALAVSATDQSGTFAFLSNHGDWIDLAAPGFDILTTSLSYRYYEVVDGTSFAAPLVSAAAALVRARQPALTPAQVESRLRTTARDAGPRGVDPYYGHGVLDVAAAVGRPYAAPFPLRDRDARESDDLPDHASLLTAGTTTSATLAPEGDVDWYRFEVAAPATVTVTVTPPRPDAQGVDGRWMDPVVELFDADLQLLDLADDRWEGEPETVSATVRPGSYRVRVSNWLPSASNGPHTVRLTTAVTASSPEVSTGPFHPPLVRNESWYPEGVTVGDVTGDTRPDVLVTSNTGRVAVLPGLADGTLGPMVATATVGAIGAYEGHVRLLQPDGAPPRVAVGTRAGLQLLVWDGTELVSQEVLEPGTWITRVAVGDVDADGREDLIAHIENVGIVAYRQLPDGWAREVVHDGEVTDLTTGRPDGADAASVVSVQRHEVRVDRRAPDGAWSRTTYLTAEVGGARRNASGVGVGDTDGDGYDDVHVSVGGKVGKAIQRLRGSAGGTLRDPEVTPTVDVPQPVEVADVTGDGTLDVVTAHGGWQRVSTLAGTAGGALGPPTTTTVPMSSHYATGALALADVDADGDVDAVLVSHNHLLLLEGMQADAATPPAADIWARATTPRHHATDAAHAAGLRVTLAHDVTAAQVTTKGAVRLVDGRTGRAVAASVTLDGTRELVVTPTSALIAGTPYALHVSDLRELDLEDAWPEPLRLPFVAARDATAPPPVTGPTASSPAPGQLRASWTRPTVADLDLIEVRVTETTTWPTPTTGRLIYRGTGTSLSLPTVDASKVQSLGIWAVDRSGNRSTRANVRLDGTGIATSRSASRIVHGDPVDLRATVSSAASGKAIAGRTVELWERRAPSPTWRRVATANSNEEGRVTFTRTPSVTTAYRVRVIGTATAMAREVGAGTVGVSPRITARLSATTVKRGATVNVIGTVRPTASMESEAIELQRLRDGQWVRVQRSGVKHDGGYSFFGLPTGTRGTFTYRVVSPANPAHAAGTSNRMTLTVQ